jgi:hypothetical protein
MVKPVLSALLRASKRSDILQKPVQAGISNSDAWPQKEHETLKGALLEDDFFTDLMLIMQFNQINLKEEISSVSKHDRDEFRLNHENALSYRIEGTTTNKGSLYNFEQRLKAIKIIVVQHVQDCLQELSPSQREKSLFTSEQTTSGAVSQDANLRASRRLHTIVNPILANNLLTPGPNEKQLINDLILKENNLKASATVKPTTLEKMKRECKAYAKSLQKMRELFTHYILYALGALCPAQTVDQLKVLQQQHFLSAAYKAASDDAKPPFTALKAINYLETECHTTNTRTVTALKRVLERMARYHNESLFAWLHRFPPLVNELELASKKTFNTLELKELWKLNFAKHINAKEATLIKVHHGDHINTTEWNAIQDFGKGVFNFEAMSKLATQMATSLPQWWKPDFNVNEWNDQKLSDLQWDHPVSHVPPSRKRKKDYGAEEETGDRRNRKINTIKIVINLQPITRQKEENAISKNEKSSRGVSTHVPTKTHGHKCLKTVEIARCSIQKRLYRKMNIAKSEAA